MLRFNMQSTYQVAHRIGLLALDLAQLTQHLERREELAAVVHVAQRVAVHHCRYVIHHRREYLESQIQAHCI